MKKIIKLIGFVIIGIFIYPIIWIIQKIKRLENENSK